MTQHRSQSLGKVAIEENEMMEGCKVVSIGMVEAGEASVVLCRRLGCGMEIEATGKGDGSAATLELIEDATHVSVLRR